MTDKIKQDIGEFEVANARQNLSLLRNQLEAGQISKDLLERQLGNLDSLLERLGKAYEGQRNVARFEALYNVSRVLGSSLDLQTVLNQVMDAIIKLTGAERGFLMLRDDDGGVAVKVARNLDQQTLSSDEFKYSRTVINQVLDSEQAILTTNASEDPRFASQASVIGQALRSVMATPLRARGSVIGVAYVDSRATVGLFNDDDLAAMDTFSAQAAIAVDNAILFSDTDEALARRVDELQQLRRIDHVLSDTLDVDKATAYTLETAFRLSSAKAGYLALMINPDASLHPTDDDIEIKHTYGVDDPPTNLLETFPGISTVIATGKTVYTSGVDSATFIVPISREKKVMGIVLLTRDDNFSDENRDMIERIVARASVAIDKSLLYDRVQAADMAKSEFVGIVAHDLKAPMTTIRGYAELVLMDGGISANQEDYIERVKSTVDRMEALVSDLADISRIESGHFFMDEIRVAPREIIQGVKDSTLPEIQNRKHTLVENVEDDLPYLWVDYYRLLQVLINLVSNAYKYTPEGGTVTVSVRKRNDERVEFSVADTGIGLSQQQIKKLGMKFWRAEDEFTRSQPGTGLGFSITSSLIQQMGSQIQIESEPGQGSRFTFDVAIAKE